MRAAVARVQAAADHWDAASIRIASFTDAQVKKNAQPLADINHLLYSTERLLTDTAGLPQRDWFRHLIYAPGFYTGYGVKTMPGIREAVEDVPDLTVAQAQAARVAAALEHYAAQIEQAAQALNALQ